MKSFYFKSTIFFLGLLVFLSYNCFSQTFYLKSFYSSNIGISPKLYSSYDEDINFSFDDESRDYTLNSTKFSMGSGNSFGLAGGVKFFENISFELDANYFKSKTNFVNYTTTITYQPLNAYNVSIKELVKYNAKSLNFTPSILITANEKMFTPYFKFGFIFSFINFSSEIEQEIYNNFPGYYPRESYEYGYRYSPNFIFGWSESIGVDFILSKKTNFYFELSHVNLNYSPEYMKCIKYRYDREDNMHNINPAEEMIYFVDSYSTSDASVHGRKLKEIHSLNRINLQFGLKYFF